VQVDPPRQCAPQRQHADVDQCVDQNGWEGVTRPRADHKYRRVAPEQQQNAAAQASVDQVETFQKGPMAHVPIIVLKVSTTSQGPVRSSPFASADTSGSWDWSPAERGDQCHSDAGADYVIRPPRHLPLRFPFVVESASSWRLAPCLAHHKKRRPRRPPFSKSRKRAIRSCDQPKRRTATTPRLASNATRSASAHALLAGTVRASAKLTAELQAS